MPPPISSSDDAVSLPPHDRGRKNVVKVVTPLAVVPLGLSQQLRMRTVRSADAISVELRTFYPDLDATAPADAYSRGFLDGIRAFSALLPLLHEGPNHDPAEFWRRLYDPDVLPVG